MTPIKRERQRKRRILNIVRALSCVVALVVIVLILHAFTGILDKVLPGSNKTEEKGAGSIASGAVHTMASIQLPQAPSVGDGSQSTAGDGTQTSNGQGTQTPSGEDQPGSDPSGTTPNTSHTLNNQQITDLASLSNKNEGWGPGSDTDEKNRPHSTLSYQERYGKYNAHFIVPDSDKIYLTMDEGYENGCTPAILDTLKEKNVKAVFFVTSQFVKKNPELVQRMIDEGHMVGNHSISHPADGLPSQTIEQQQHEVLGLHDYVKENFNYEMHLFRYPAGKFSEQSLAVVNNCNYKSVFWSFAYLDYDVNNQPDKAKAMDKLMSKLHPGAIYLLHAVSTTNTEILGDFIDQARAQGYEFGLFD